MKDGDVDIDTSDSPKDFSRFKRNDVFSVERIKTDPGKAYRLECSTCDIRPPLN